MSGYEVVFADSAAFTATMFGETGGPVQLQVKCEDGKKPIGGGHEMLNETSYGLNVVASAPYEEAGETGWRVVVKNKFAPMISGARVRVFAVCAQMAQ